MINAETRVTDENDIRQRANGNTHFIANISDKFIKVGQNIAGIGTNGSSYPNANDSIRGILLTFYNQYKDANMSDIQSYHNKYE